MNLQKRDDFLVFTSIFLMGLLLVAMALAAWTGVSPMTTIRFHIVDLGIGLAAAGLMVIAFSQVTSAQEEAEEAMGASLAACHWYDLIMLALLVGIIEEVLFRGVIEMSIAQWNPLYAMIIVNILFGALHSLSITYFVVATILGVFLSLIAQGPGEYNLLRPIVAHAAYDYIGFVWLASKYRKRIPEPHEIEDDMRSDHSLSSETAGEETSESEDSTS